MVRLRSCLLLVLILVVPLSVAQGQTLLWEPVGEGIEYRKFTLSDPNNVFVARMERAKPIAIIESSIASGALAEGKETVSGMAARYNEAINYWGGSLITPTWGLRNDVVVAINGSYYDIPTGIPQGGQIHSGWYDKRFDDLGGGSGFGWTLGRQAFIGECVVHRQDRQLVTFVTSGLSQQIDGINIQRGDDRLVLYTPQYASDTQTNDSGVEVLVELTRPAMILPTPAAVVGYVRQVRIGNGSTHLPFDYIVLSASGTATPTLVANAQVGGEIHISQEITSFESDCETSRPLSWTKTFASIQGAFLFLRDGVIQEFVDPGANEREPRTAIAFNDQYIYFIVVDGRDSLLSVGMTTTELGIFISDTLTATWGITQDGGGSSTMVINGEVVNNVYCNNVYCIYEYQTFLPMVSRGVDADYIKVQKQRAEEPALIAADYERLVANGMMMVNVLPEAYSQAFTPGQVVTTTRQTGLYLGPGSNYTSIFTLPLGTPGIVLGHMNGLNGVLAKGAFWWKVDYGTLSGWVKESSLSAGSASMSSRQLSPPGSQCAPLCLPSWLMIDGW